MHEPAHFPAPMRVTLLAGGVGGAKLAHGFQQVLEPGELTVVVNVADDFELWGLHISPDLDTVTYTLAGMANPETGWGIRGDTWTALAMLERLGAPAWFRVGDADLALHVRRTQRLRDGASLSEVCAETRAALGVASRILPASDDRVRTIITTDEGELAFQEYFVARRQEPEVRALRFDGIERAAPTATALAAIAEADLLVIAPSNPLVSVAPILELPGLRDAWVAAEAPKLAVSPIVRGRALKGPADRMLASLGHESSALGVARLYIGLVDVFVVDETDASLAPAVTSLGMAAHPLPTVMRTDADRAALADRLLRLPDAMLTG